MAKYNLSQLQTEAKKTYSLGDLESAQKAGQREEAMAMNQGGTDESWKDLPFNILPSAGRLVGSVVGAVTHPKRTIKAITSLPFGIGEKFGASPGQVLEGILPGMTAPAKIARAIGGEKVDAAVESVEQKLLKLAGSPQKDSGAMIDALKDYVVDRYGSLDNLKKTTVNDPMGVLTDIASIFTGAGAAAKGAGAVSKVSELSKVGSTLSKVGSTIDPLTNIAKGAGTVAGKARQIGGKALDAEAIATANKLGIPESDLPVSVMSKSPVTRGAEAIAAKGLGGQQIATRFENLNNKLVDSIAGLTEGKKTSQEIGKSLVKSVDNYKKNFFNQKTELYSEAIKNIPAKFGGFKPSATTELLDNLIAQERSALVGLGQKTSPELQTYAGLRSGLGKGNISFRNVYNTLQKLQDDIKFGTTMKTGNNAKLSKISATLDNEFASQLKAAKPEVAEMIDKADALFKEGVEKINSSFAQAILQNIDEPSRIIEEILPRIDSVEDIAKIESVVGKENMDQLRKAMIDDIMTRSISKTDNKLTPAGIGGAMRKYGRERVEALLTPDQIGTLDAVDELNKVVGKTGGIVSGSQTAYLSNILNMVGPGGAGAFIAGVAAGSPAIALAGLSGVLGPIALNKFIGSSLGRKILTKGVKFEGKYGKQLVELAKKNNLGPYSRAAQVINTTSQQSEE